MMKNKNISMKLLFVLLSCVWLLSSCETDQEEILSGYVVYSLYEINGKQTIDRTAEIEPCRKEEIWSFDFLQKRVTHSFDAVNCPPAPWKGNYTQPFDTGYVDSLKGRFFMERLSHTVASTPPPLHKDFPMRFPRFDYREEVLFYALVKFDENEIVLRNQFDYRKPVKDTQFYELTFKYREP